MGVSQDVVDQFGAVKGSSLFAERERTTRESVRWDLARMNNMDGILRGNCVWVTLPHVGEQDLHVVGCGVHVAADGTDPSVAAMVHLHMALPVASRAVKNTWSRAAFRDTGERLDIFQKMLSVR